MTVLVEQLAESVGAEVSGVDLSRPLEAGDLSAIRKAHLDLSVVVFRDQRLTPEQHIAFSSHFGDFEIHVMAQFLLPGHPEVLVISNDKNDAGEAIGIEDAGRYWHSDLSYLKEPSLGSMLYAVEVPPEGGNTMFAGMYAAYDALPGARREELAGLRATHHFASRWLREKDKAGVRPPMSDEQLAQTPPVDHPIVRTHPETGRKSIFAGGFCTGVAGMGEEEGLAFVDELTAFSTQPQFTYTHEWRVGDLVFWDNRCAMHHATDYDSSKYRRHMLRTTIKGDTPV